VYDTLFEATWETLQQFGKTKVQMGMIAVLHTWAAIELASSLALHCRAEEWTRQWKNGRSNGKISISVRLYRKF
jgi:hypothetical protein